MAIGSDVYAKVVLSTDTKPIGAYSGQLIIESDTGKVYEWSGTTWYLRTAALDTSGTRTIISYEHSKVHQGKFYTANYYLAGVANGSSIEILVQTPSDKTVHNYIKAASGGDSLFYTFEDATFSAEGTAITPINNNRSSANTADATITHTPTLTADGTQLGNPEFIPGGHGGVSVGSSEGIGKEQFVLNSNTVYLLRLTNIAGSAQALSIVLGFYEV